MPAAPYSIVLHAPDADSLQRARNNAVNALRADPATQIRIIANAGGVAAALEQPHEATDALLWLCPNTLKNLERTPPAPLKVLDGAAVLELARLQTEGWVYIRA